MRHTFTRTLVLLIAIFVIDAAPSMAQQRGGAGADDGAGSVNQCTNCPPILTLAVTSTSFPDGGEIPVKYRGQQGTSPQLSWSGAPAGTMSYALIMYDIDVAVPAASLANDITHWVVWNIPAATTSLPEGGPIPAGANQTSLRGPQYLGPAPPRGHPTHHYIFQIFALNARLDVPANGAARADIEKAMDGKILARGSYFGRARPQ